MGIFSAIRERLGRKKQDYGDIKSHVLDQPFPPPSANQQKFDERFGPALDQEEFPREPDFPEIRRNAERERLSMEDVQEPSPRFRKDYDIMEQLNLMEAQLAAIRAQTEAINERLKNLEARLTRRY